MNCLAEDVNQDKRNKCARDGNQAKRKENKHYILNHVICMYFILYMHVEKICQHPMLKKHVVPKRT